jgi:hypothetical protein
MSPKKAFLNLQSKNYKDSLDPRKNYIKDIIKPYGNNSVKVLGVLYDDRDYYKNKIIPYVSSYFPEKEIFCDLFENNFLYGLVDKDLNAILPTEGFMKLMPSANEDPQYAMDFVVDAFQEMSSYLNNAVILGKLSKDSPYFDLKVYRSYLDPRVQINDNHRKIVTEFKKKIINDMEFSSKVKDISTFNKYFILFLRDIIKKKYTVTKTSNILDNNFISFSSGLIFDIAKDKADDDLLKFNKYLSKEDFLIFAEACKRFGFLIDKNMPWRLVADINSPAMLEKSGNHTGYMLRYNISSADDLFSKRYNPVFLDDLYQLKKFFYDSYGSLINDYPYYELDYKKLQSCQFYDKTVYERPSGSFTEYTKKFADSYWIRVYCYLRNYEEQVGLTQIEFDNIVREANNFVIAKKTDRALIYVNKYFKKFDKIQYLSSLQKEMNPVKQEVQSNIKPELVF